MWSQRKIPSHPRSSARAARSARSRGSLSALNGARVSPRLASAVMALNVYLSGEIHTDWRERIERGAAEAGLDVEFGAPVTDHAASDNAGVAILGEQERPFWKDNLGAGLNTIRTRTLLERADVVVVRFGDQYRRWNAAFDAGYAVALGKPLVVLHPEAHDHALKEVDRAALAVAREPEQVVDILRYALHGLLPAVATPR